MATRCSVCQASCFDKPLYRNNPKGEVADWRCEEDLDRDPPEAAKSLAEMILKSRNSE